MKSDARRTRGIRIARTLQIKASAGGWRVPKSSGANSHFVRKNKHGLICSCQDFELRAQPCKHIYAVLQFMSQETLYEEQLVTEPRQRKTYSQNWPAYNLSQTLEKDMFVCLLRDLCEIVGSPSEERGKGRPRIPLKVSLFSAAYKVYSNLSARRFMSDLRAAEKSQLIEKAPCHNHVLETISNPLLKPVINRMIELSCFPLKSVESAFAADGTGFGVHRYYRHYSVKRGKNFSKKEFVKLHACIGIATHIITAAEITKANIHDNQKFEELIDTTSETFRIEEVSADKGYLSHHSFDVVDRLGATPYIPFKILSALHETHGIWNRMFHLFNLNRQEFLAHYHKRSNVEATFSSIKRLFAPFVRARTFPAQENELLLKVLVYNLTRLIRASFELGIELNFGPEDPNPSRSLGETGEGWRLL